MRPIDVYDTSHKPAKYLGTGWFQNKQEAKTEGASFFGVSESNIQTKTALPFKTIS